MSKAQIVSVFLFGSQFSPKQNNDLFFHIQSFISESFLHVLDKTVQTWKGPLLSHFITPLCKIIKND